MRVWSFVWRVWIGGMLISLTVGAYNAGNLIAMVLSGMLGIYLIYRGLVYLIKGDPHQAAAAQSPAAAPSPLLRKYATSETISGIIERHILTAS